MKRLVLILGTGRSGTSLVSRTVGELGFDLGTNLIPGDALNSEGYYEDRDIVNAHKLLLSDLGCGDPGVLQVPPDWLSRELTGTIKARIVELLSERFSSTDKVAVKDPRISLLLPMWYEIAASLDVELKLVFCARSPAAVAASAVSLDTATGEAMWLCRVMSAAENWTGGFVLNYEDILRDAPSALNALARWLGGESQSLDTQALVKSELNHHPDDLPIQNEFVKKVYRALGRGESAGLLIGRDKILKSFRSSLQMLDGLVANLRILEGRKRELTADSDIASGLAIVTRFLGVAEQRILEAVRTRSNRILNDNNEVKQAIRSKNNDVQHDISELRQVIAPVLASAQQSFEDVITHRAEKVIASERGAWEGRLNVLVEQHGRELASEREAGHARLKALAEKQGQELASERDAWDARLKGSAAEHARELAKEKQKSGFVEKLTEENRLQELRIQNLSNQLDALKAWRSANGAREQQLATLTTEFNEKKQTLTQLVRSTTQSGDWQQSVIISTLSLKALAESARMTPVIALDRANPFALIFRGIRAIKARPSRFRRRVLHLYYLLLLRQPGKARDAMAVATSGLFDASYYTARYKDVTASKDPLLHFMDVGAQEGRDPSPLFSAKYYRESNPAVARANKNSLLYFLRKGRAEGHHAYPNLTVASMFGNLLGGPAVMTNGAKSTKSRG